MVGQDGLVDISVTLITALLLIIDPYVGGGAPLMGDGKGGPLFAKRPSSFINGGNLGNIPVSHGGFGGECIRL